MNIEERAKYILPSIEAGKMGKVVRNTIKQIKYAKQDQYDVNKEMYEPLIDKMEKEVEEISNLREEYVKNRAIDNGGQQQLAITDGKNVDNMMKNIADLDKGFGDEEAHILNGYKLRLPSKVLGIYLNNNEYLAETMGRVGEYAKELGRIKGSKSKKSNKEENKYEIEEINMKLSVLNKYKDRIASFKEGKYMLQTGKGYVQKKRNAYKVTNGGQYGELKIDVPQLTKHLKLVAYNGDGKKVIDKLADFDFLDLITKKYNNNKKYSPLSKTLFEELNTLSNIPIHRTSNKFAKIGSGVVYFNNPKDLISRMELLGGSIKAGNDSAKNEFGTIVHKLAQLGVLSKDQLNDLIREYIGV